MWRPTANCGANSPCYARLQDAVDAAGDGDEIRVAAGRYSGVASRNGTTQLVYLAKSIFIRGGYHPQLWTQDHILNPTILDAAGQGRVLFITGVISPAIDGFHLISGTAGSGGGVYVDGAAAILSNNEIYGNFAEGWGGGVYLNNSAATLLGNHIYTNTTGASGRGGGLALTDSPATVEDNIIEDNRAHVGGGVTMNNTLAESGARLIGNTLRNNVAFDLEQDGRTFDGAGGGLDLSSYLTDTLRNNSSAGTRPNGAAASMPSAPRLSSSTTRSRATPPPSTAAASTFRAVRSRLSATIFFPTRRTVGAAA